MSRYSNRRSNSRSGRKSGKGGKNYQEPQEQQLQEQQLQEQQLQLYIAVYEPSEGHYYHWAFAIYDEATQGWHTFDAARSYENGPFNTQYLAVDPRNLFGCLQPMTVLATYPRTSLNTITGAIGRVVAQTDADWDCQSYVRDIINTLIRENLVTDAEYQAAWGRVSPFYGYRQEPFGAQRPAADDQRILSDEYIIDSDKDS